ncbi:MAG: acylphosphatase [Acidobacteriota bacterium]|nr:acylphosphatase [Acidobacteriota bacterium]
MEAAEIKITGRVQGVGFRYFTMLTAQELGLLGWVKNMPDGSVLTRAAGAPEAMAAFRERLRQGPSYGRTDGLEEIALDEREAAALGDFRVTY